MEDEIAEGVKAIRQAARMEVGCTSFCLTSSSCCFIFTGYGCGCVERRPCCPMYMFWVKVWGVLDFDEIKLIITLVENVCCAIGILTWDCGSVFVECAARVQEGQGDLQEI